MFIMGGIFVVITVACPKGLAGLVEDYGGYVWTFLKKIFKSNKTNHEVKGVPKLAPEMVRRDK